eukprot:Tbor_TRINITY_DN5173_c0_g1::TRINITY_DN5173_c0_g1_i1::g.26052::m.26052
MNNISHNRITSAPLRKSLQSQATAALSAIRAAYDRHLAHREDAYESVRTNTYSLSTSPINRSNIVSSFDVAQEALRMLMSAPMSLGVGSGNRNGNVERPFAALQEVQEELRARSNAAQHLLVPRDVINEFDGFVPFLLKSAERSKILHQSNDSKTPTYDNEQTVVDNFDAWLELFCPTKDATNSHNGSSNIPFCTLIGAMDAFLLYERGGIEYHVPLGESIRPFYGVGTPKDPLELKAYQRFFHWVNDRTNTSIFSALDIGCKSGYVAALLVKAKIPHVLCVDDNDAAIMNTSETLARLKEMKRIKKKVVTTLRSSTLLPPQEKKENQKQSGTTQSEQNNNNNANISATEVAGIRRRHQGRLLPSVQPKDEDIAEELADKYEKASYLTNKKNLHDIAVFHALVPPLFDHPLLNRDSTSYFSHSSPDVLKKISDLIHNNHGADGVGNGDYSTLLHPDRGHLALIGSNWYDLLSSTSQQQSQPHSYSHLFPSVCAGEGSSVGSPIIGWETVGTFSRSLAPQAEHHLSQRHFIGSHLLVSDQERGALYRDIRNFYSKLKHELVIVKPIRSRVWEGLPEAMRRKMSSLSNDTSSYDSLNSFNSNKLIDWEDTYEYNHYLPKDGSGNPFHYLSAQTDFSYLEDTAIPTYDDGVLAEGEVGKIREDYQLLPKTFYERRDPSNVAGNVPKPHLERIYREQIQQAHRHKLRAEQLNKQLSHSAGTSNISNSSNSNDGAAISQNPELMKNGSGSTISTTLMYDALFNRESRLIRQKQWRKIALESDNKKKEVIERKVVESESAKLRILDEIARFDFRQPR